MANLNNRAGHFRCDSGTGPAEAGNMQLQQIKYFLVLREELNFTRAAQRCGVSQPTLTGCIKRLEAELGGLLFARRRKISVTHLGRAMAPYFERIVQEAQDALDAALRCAGRQPAKATQQRGARRASPDARL